MRILRCNRPEEQTRDLRLASRIGVIAHRLSTDKNVDWVYVLDEGRVIEQGTYHELRTRENGEFREMVEMQSL